MEDYAILGGGGFGRELFFNIKEVVVEKNLRWNFLGFFDDGTANIELFSRLGRYLGNTNNLNQWTSKLNLFLAIADPVSRKSVFQKIENKNVCFPNFIYSNVRFLDLESFKMGSGNILLSNCSFSIDLKLGDFNVFISSTSVGHDSIIGDFNSFMPGSRISGNVQIGDLNQLGMNSTINQNLTLGTNNKIAPNTWVSKSIKDQGTYYGSMMKKL